MNTTQTNCVYVDTRAVLDVGSEREREREKEREREREKDISRRIMSSSSARNSAGDGASLLSFGAVIRRRLVEEMLRSVRSSEAEWSVLIMDALTTKVMSSVVRMSEVLDDGVSLVEDISKNREPFPRMNGVYFVQPTPAAVKTLIADFRSERRKLYKRAHIFFTSTVPASLLAQIKASPELLRNLATLKQVNLELLVVDSQAFVTGQPTALRTLYSEGAGGLDDPEPAECVEVISKRLATAFESLREMPSIRYFAPRPSSPIADHPSLGTLSQRVAERVYTILSQDSQLGHHAETCDLLVIERGVDPVSPCIHDFYYEPMAYDLLEIDAENSSYKYSVETNKGSREERLVILNDLDPLWMDLRFMHVGEALLSLDKKTRKFGSKNKAASMQAGGGSGGGALSTRDLKNLVQALPQFREQLSKLALHVEIASKINETITGKQLDKFGELEQNIVLGDSHGKELIKVFQEDHDSDKFDRLRLLLCYFATHPGKLDTVQKQLQWQKLARLSAEDMNAINNMQYIGVQLRSDDHGAGGGSKNLKFGAKKNRYKSTHDRLSRRERKERATGKGDEEEEEWGLSRFQPLVMDLLEDYSAGTLSKSEYPFVREPDNMENNDKPIPIKSARTSRSTTSVVGETSDVLSRKVESSLHLGKRRLVVFIIGGATRAELRVRDATLSTVTRVHLCDRKIENHTPSCRIAALRIHSLSCITYVSLSLSLI